MIVTTRLSRFAKARSESAKYGARQSSRSNDVDQRSVVESRGTLEVEPENMERPWDGRHLVMPQALPKTALIWALT